MKTPMSQENIKMRKNKNNKKKNIESPRLQVLSKSSSYTSLDIG